MTVEASFSLTALGALLARLCLRLLPNWFRRGRGISNALFFAHAKELKDKFNDMGSPHDRHDEWLAIQRAAIILRRLEIPHPSNAARPEVWRAFLPEIIHAAEDGNVTQARAVMSRDVWKSATIPSDFAAPSPPPNLTVQPSEPPENPGERTYTSRTAGELFSAVVGLTSLEMERFARPHVGKWIRVQSVIQDMWTDNNFLYVRLGLWFEPTPILCFRKGIWRSRLETMSRGDSLAACGKIAKIELLGMVMTDCEIVKTEGNNESFRRPSTNDAGTRRATK